MRTIDVPKVEPEAYNPDRPISGLIHMQLVHLSAAEQTLPPEKRTGVNIAMLHSESQAADYIQTVTALLRSQAKSKTAEEARTTSAQAGSPKARG
jgi:hypothetical protein